jgi:hypothetical protein
MRRISSILILAVIVSAPTAAIAVRAITRTVSQIFDPCVRWDSSATSGNGSMSASIGPNDACRSVTVNGESKLRAFIVGALVPEVLLLSTLLATIGVALARRWLIFGASVLMLAETPVVFTIAPLTLMTGLLYLFFANRSHPPQEVITSKPRSAL